MDLSTPFTKEDFSFTAKKDLRFLGNPNDPTDIGWLQADIIFYCEALREAYMRTKEPEYLVALNEILPNSFIRK